MKKVLILFLFFIILDLNVSAQAEIPIKIFLLRHTETLDDGTRDPELSDKGLARAYQWVKVLQNEDIDEFYSTDLRRTQALAGIIANASGIQKIHTYKRDMDIPKFLKEIKGKTVLISGHSNTTPFIVNKIIGMEQYKQIDDKDYSNLFIITYYNKNQVSVNLLQIPFTYKSNKNN